MLVWLGQAVNSSALLIKTRRTAAFFNATIASPLMLSSRERSNDSKSNPQITLIMNTNLCNLWMGLLSEPANGPTREIDPNALHLRVKFERVLAHLAAAALMLVTTKGRRCVEHIEGIDPDHARFDLFRETMRARDVPGPNPG